LAGVVVLPFGSRATDVSAHVFALIYSIDIGFAVSDYVLIYPEKRRYVCN